ncbi:MAG: hypothetical protein RLP13_15725, partial [Cytophagales bacterium]
MKKYSEIKKDLKFSQKNFDDTRLSAFTHYLQSSNNGTNSYFIESASDYYNENAPDVHDTSPLDLLLPIKWDIPFPPPDKPKF